MPFSRTCPVCLTAGAIIRPDARTCSRECSKEWTRMSRLEQQTRLAETTQPIQRKINQLKDKLFNDKVEDFIEDDLGLGGIPSFVDPSLTMPKGILPERLDIQTNLPITNDPSEKRKELTNHGITKEEEDK